MFEGFANVWTAATLARNLKKRQPLRLRVAGEDLVLFRDEGGRASALLDRCPHRGVRLSLGKVKGGCLECPFHAWHFDGRGEVRHVPLNPDAKRERLFAQAIPTRELGGLLWIYTAPREPGFEPTVPDALTLEGAARTYLEVEWNAHWTRAMENMLDAPHVPFVHATTIGRFVRPYLHADSTMHLALEETSYGARSRSWLDDRRDQPAAFLDFYKPNIMVLNIPIPGKVFRMHALCVPVDEARVRMIVVGARTFATSALLNPFFNFSNWRIVKQDQAVVESSAPVKIPPPASELSVRTDRVTLYFRNYYFQQLEPSSAPPRGRLTTTQAA